MSHTLRMRRAFVIFLILLFPFNVFALSLSAALAGQAGSAVQTNATPATADTAMADGGADADGAGDIDPDPDEPPSGAELHYIVGQGGLSAFDSRATAATAPHDAAPHSHAIAPPVRPPRHT